MRKLLIILFLLGAFLFYSYAGQEEDKAKVVIIDPEDTNMIYDWPLWLFNHGYTSSYDSNWMNNYRYGRGGAIVLRKPPSFGESFLQGFSKGMSKSMDYYYREREQRRYTKTMLKLLESLSSKDYRPKFNQPYKYRRYTGLERAEPLNKYKMSPEERQANWERIIELDRIIERKKERANLDKLFREAGWSDKDRVEYLDKYYPLPLTKETKFSWLDKFDPLDKKEKEEDNLTKYMRSLGAMLPREYKMKKLNEYLKSQNLPEVPLVFEVNEIFHGEWIIYWNGEKWARKKKEVNHEGP